MYPGPLPARPLAVVDEGYTARPFHGSRRMAAELDGQGEAVNRKRVQPL